MLERKLIDTAQVPGGAELQLISHGRDHMITLARNELMSTRMQFSEEQLAELTIDRLQAAKPHMLIGGYGMGFTLRAALRRLPADATVIVAELVPKIIEWARGPMAHHTGDCLADPRLTLDMTDVADLIAEAADGMRAQFDAILLDVDNGPDGLVREENDKLVRSLRNDVAHLEDYIKAFNEDWKECMKDRIQVYTNDYKNKILICQHDLKRSWKIYLVTRFQLTTHQCLTQKHQAVVSQRCQV